MFPVAKSIIRISSRYINLFLLHVKQLNLNLYMLLNLRSTRKVRTSYCMRIEENNSNENFVISEQYERYKGIRVNNLSQAEENQPICRSHV